MAGALLKQGNYIVNAAQYKMLLTAIWEDWSTIRLTDEFEIMVEYAKRGAFFSRLYCGRINHIENSSPLRDSFYTPLQSNYRTWRFLLHKFYSTISVAIYSRHYFTE
ncbi:uncharacterized protein LOC117211072 [Bombus bifarius]|uniref:Uncharacterized protein LOC117211072 n=1 Tax=Bombus bifarius TaxID=103933 RepID=A0A6P8M9T3_9HYME|nr:uncharacterized protein LOC117211072 [Bombus bifarius]